jgi:MoaA/NifB/PqqE/SkfB family radical SAM enzyme
VSSLIAMDSDAWTLIKQLAPIGRSLSDGPLLVYGSLALQMYGSAQSPVDLDLLVPDGVAPKLIDSLSRFGFTSEPTPYLGAIFKQRYGGLEVHDFQSYSDDFFLLSSPGHCCKWQDLLRFSVDAPEVEGVKIPSLPLALVLCAKYLHDWIFLDSIAQSSPDVQREVDIKWPRLLQSFGDLLGTIATQKHDPEEFLVEVLGIAKALSFGPVLKNFRYYLQLLRPVNPVSAGLFWRHFESVPARQLLRMFEEPIRTKRCGSTLYMFSPVTGSLIEVSETSRASFAADFEFAHSTPHAASVQVTSRCNLTCQHCAFGHDGEAMDKKLFETVLARLQLLGVFEINLGEGGEATLHPDLPMLVHLARNRFGFVVNLTSNLARPLSEDYLNLLGRSLSSVHSSYDDLHFNSADYRSTLERNLRALRERVGCRLGINIAYSAGHIGEASATLDDAIARLAPIIDQISLLKVSVPYSPWALSDSDEVELQSMFRRIDAVGLRIGFHACDESAARAFNSVSELPQVNAGCGAWREFIYIDVSGRISPCGIRHPSHVAGHERLVPITFSVDPLQDSRDCRMCAYDCN